MILSMTGFGPATGELAAFRGGVVIRSLNHRFLEVAVRLPNVLAPLELEIKELVASRVRRGRVDVVVRGEVHGCPARVSVSETLAGALVSSLRTLAATHALEGTIRVSDLARFPGLIEVHEDSLAGAEAARADVLRLVAEALERLDVMRRSEGERSAAAISALLETIERTVEGVERSADEGRGLRRAALGERARELAADLGLDEPRLLQEIARVVDRSDISEELQRLRGHVAHAREVMRDGVPAGKTLDFLAQEMAREANTIAAKSPAGGAGREVITLRAEIERLREQVQNVE